MTPSTCHGGEPSPGQAHSGGFKEAFSPTSASGTRLDLSWECRNAAPISTSNPWLHLAHLEGGVWYSSIAQGAVDLLVCLTNQGCGALISLHEAFRPWEEQREDLWKRPEPRQGKTLYTVYPPATAGEHVERRSQTSVFPSHLMNSEKQDPTHKTHTQSHTPFPRVVRRTVLNPTRYPLCGMEPRGVGFAPTPHQPTLGHRFPTIWVSVSAPASVPSGPSVAMAIRWLPVCLPWEPELGVGGSASTLCLLHLATVKGRALRACRKEE